MYADPIPLRLEDLIEDLPAEMQYSTEVQGEESFLVSDKTYSQIPLTTEDLPQPLYYRVVKVKVPALYGLCQNSLLREWQDEIVDGTPERVSHYEPIDPGPWGAQEAYRLYFGENRWDDAYLICWKDTIVKLEWSQVQQLTSQQMAVVGEKVQLN